MGLRDCGRLSERTDKPEGEQRRSLNERSQVRRGSNTIGKDRQKKRDRKWSTKGETRKVKGFAGVSEISTGL